MAADSGANLFALGKYLAEVRSIKGWSLRKAAKITGLSHTTICRLENAEKQTLPELSTLQLIADAYEIPLKIIFHFLASDELWEDFSPFPRPPALGQLICSWRRKKGLSPDALINKLPWLDKALLKNIEEGILPPPERELEDLLQALELSPEEKGELLYLGGVLNNIVSSGIYQACAQALEYRREVPAYALAIPFWQVLAANRWAGCFFFTPEEINGAGDSACGSASDSASDSPFLLFDPPLSFLDALLSPKTLISSRLQAAGCWSEVAGREIAAFKYLSRRFAHHNTYQQFIHRLFDSHPVFKEAWTQQTPESIAPAYLESEMRLRVNVRDEWHNLHFYCSRNFLTADHRIIIVRYIPLDEVTRKVFFEARKSSHFTGR